MDDKVLQDIEHANTPCKIMLLSHQVYLSGLFFKVQSHFNYLVEYFAYSRKVACCVKVTKS